MLTRAELKQRAKDSMSTASIHPVLVTLVFLLVTFAVTESSASSVLSLLQQLDLLLRSLRTMKQFISRNACYHDVGHNDFIA